MTPRRRRTLLRLALLLGVSLLVSYGLLKGLAFLAKETLPPFRPAATLAVTAKAPGAKEPFFHEGFESLETTPWRHFIRHGKTDYSLFQGEGGTSLKAVSRASASGLLREIRFRPQEHPILSWRWKVEGVLEGADLKTKKGSDAVARIYVIFEGKGPFSMERLLNYVWAWDLPKETALRSYFSSNSRILVVESGKEGVGEWRSESRNLVDDYRRAFQEEPKEVKGIVIMTDSDNTGGEATAYYDDVMIGEAGEREANLWNP